MIFTNSLAEEKVTIFVETLPKDNGSVDFLIVNKSGKELKFECVVQWFDKRNKLWREAFPAIHTDALKPARKFYTLYSDITVSKFEWLFRNNTNHVPLYSEKYRFCIKINNANIYSNPFLIKRDK